MQKVIPETAILVPDQADKVFEGEIFDVYQWQQEQFDGSSEKFEMLKRPDTVVAICIVDGKIIMLDEEQPHSGHRVSFTGGRVDETDSSIVSAGEREALEETGYRFRNWRVVHVAQREPKIEWFVHILVASDVIDKRDPVPDAGEKIVEKLVSYDEVKELVNSRSRMLSEAIAVFENTNDIQDLIALPEFKGQTVDR